MKQSQAKRPTSRLAGAAIAAALMLAPTTALAEVQSLTGVDYLYPTEKSYVVPIDEDANGFVDVLAVSSSADNDMVYLKLTDAGGRIIADHLGFMLGDAEVADPPAAELVGGEASNTGEYTAMVNINIDQLNFADPSTTYNIQVYTDREETKLLYDGTIQLIYAILEGETSPRPVAVRTTNGSDLASRGCPAPAQLAFGNDTTIYERQGDTPNGDGYYEYKLASDAKDSMECHVNYYLLGDATTPLNVDGNDPVTLAKGESKVVPVPAIITAGGHYYRTLTVGNSVRLSYPGTTDAAVFVKELTGSWAKAAPYTASINYVDEDGNSVAHNDMKDTLAVIREYTYTPPKSLYVIKDGKVVEYVLSDKNNDLDANNAMIFKPGDVEDSSVVTKNVVYRQVESATEGKTWLVNYYATGTSGETNNSPAQLVEQFTISEGAEVSHGSISGTTYIPEATYNGLVCTQDSIDLSSDRTIINVYYANPGEETVYNPYNVTVNYVNISNPSQVIRSQSYQVKLTEKRSDAELDVSVPSTLAEGGVNWVILPGQLDGGPDTYHLYHNYYARALNSTEEPVYTVYFRDVNDDLHVNTVVTRVVTVYDDVVVTDLGTTTTGTTGTTTGTTTNATTGTATTGTGTGTGTAGGNATLQTGPGLQNVGTDNGSTIVRPDGTSTTEERIQNEETPLAAPEASNAAQTTNVNPGTAVGLIGGIAGIGALLAVLFARRAKAEEKVQDNNQNQN